MDGFLITHDCQQYYFILLSATAYVADRILPVNP